MTKPKQSYKQTGESKADGRICVECKTTSTPQWRYGLNGPLCNACGTRQKRSAKQWHRNSTPKCPSGTRLKVASSADLAAYAAHHEQAVHPAYFKGYMTKVVGVAGMGAEMEYRTGSRSRRTLKPSSREGPHALKRSREDYFCRPASSLSGEGCVDSDTATNSTDSNMRSLKPRRSLTAGGLTMNTPYPPYACVPADAADLLEDAADVAPALLMLANAANAQDAASGSLDSVLEAKVPGSYQAEGIADVGLRPGLRRRTNHGGSLPFMTDDYLVSKSTARVLARLHSSSRRHRSSKTVPLTNTTSACEDKVLFPSSRPSQQDIFDVEKLSEVFLGPSKARQAAKGITAPKLDSRSSSAVAPTADEHENMQYSSSTLVAKLTAIRSNIILDTCITSSPRSCSTVAATDPTADAEVASPHPQTATRSLPHPAVACFKPSGLSKSIAGTCHGVPVLPSQDTSSTGVLPQAAVQPVPCSSACGGGSTELILSQRVDPCRENFAGEQNIPFQQNPGQQPGVSSSRVLVRSTSVADGGEQQAASHQSRHIDVHDERAPSMRAEHAEHAAVEGGQMPSTAVGMDMEADAAGVTAPLSSALHEIGRLLTAEQCRTSHLEASLQKAFDEMAAVHSRLVVARYEREQLTMLARHWRDSFEELQGRYQQVLADNFHLSDQLTAQGTARSS